MRITSLCPTLIGFLSYIPHTFLNVISKSKPDCVSWHNRLFSSFFKILSTTSALCLTGSLTLVLQLFGTVIIPKQFVYISMTFMFLPVPGCLENTYPSSETKGQVDAVKPYLATFPSFGEQYALISLWHIPRSGIAGPQGKHIFVFSKYCQTVFQTDCLTL